jgi:hypothetical protein
MILQDHRQEKKRKKRKEKEKNKLARLNWGINTVQRSTQLTC